MTPINVTHVCGGTLTGCLSVVLKLLAHHDRALVTPSACFFAIEGVQPSVRRRVDALGVPYRDVVKRSRYEIGSIGRLARALGQLRTEAVVLHGFGAYAFGTLAARLARIPVIVRVEHSPELHSPLYVATSRLTARLTDSTVLVSRSLGTYLEERGVRLPFPEVIYNGVEPADFDPDANANANARVNGQGLRSGGGPPVVVMVARLDVAKDHASLLEAVALLKERGVSLRLRLVGEGPFEADLRARCERLGIVDRVEFFGFCGDMKGMLAAADIAVLITHYEGFGLVVAEAMASALPVVATRVSSLPELVDEKTGILVPPNSPGAIADALESLMRDPVRARHMGRAGRQKVIERFALLPSVRAWERHVLATAARKGIRAF